MGSPLVRTPHQRRARAAAYTQRQIERAFHKTIRQLMKRPAPAWLPVKECPYCVLLGVVRPAAGATTCHPCTQHLPLLATAYVMPAKHWRVA